MPCVLQSFCFSLVKPAAQNGVYTYLKYISNRRFQFGKTNVYFNNRYLFSRRVVLHCSHQVNTAYHFHVVWQCDIYYDQFAGLYLLITLHSHMCGCTNEQVWVCWPKEIVFPRLSELPQSCVKKMANRLASIFH